jgi:hypothetical protein
MAKRKSFKDEVVGILNAHLLNQTPFPITWNCLHCSIQHSGDLLKKVRKIDTDEDSGQIIKLLEESDKLFAILSISKNKSINKKNAQQYQELGTIYIQIDPTGNEANVEGSLATPKFVDTCLNSKCQKCGNFKQAKSLWIIDSNCWKCKAPMKVAVLDCNGFHGGPDRFSTKELSLARGKGALIQTNYSKTANDSYLSNTCPACSNFAGDHFLFTGEYCGASYGDLTFEKVELGYGCRDCDY